MPDFRPVDGGQGPAPPAGLPTLTALLPGGLPVLAAPPGRPPALRLPAHSRKGPVRRGGVSAPRGPGPHLLLPQRQRLPAARGSGQVQQLGTLPVAGKHIGQILARAVTDTHCSRNGSGGPNGYGATGASPPRPCQRPLSTTIEMELDGEGDGAGEGRLWEVTARFPPQADFVCLQEVFDLRASASLCRSLGPIYPHILYDVGSYGLAGRAGLKVFNSGLFLASRHPILAVQYHCYPNGKGEDAFAAKGLLSVQVQLGSSHGQRIVGYLNCTHMHAPEADAQVRCDQMTLGLMWAQQFQDASTQPGDIVAFDIYCGDLNFDNCSEGILEGHRALTECLGACSHTYFPIRRRPTCLIRYLLCAHGSA
uniref:sphingomyelin phosphodiesterase n=1 Tax=Anolis carolinensis TaxID=28377 RepID=A0A803TUH8_ANOCA|nr:PREDICTED: sphingomyelin phosphodiesterase 3 [Anolis carolinensis]|eukprot:XP_016853993.1 PREDICTED: sphingomyelin phosphodiesterase 3 [Anolis carolinensis]